MYLDFSIITLIISSHIDHDLATGQLLLQLSSIFEFSFQVYTSHIIPMGYNQQQVLISRNPTLSSGNLRAFVIGCTNMISSSYVHGNANFSFSLIISDIGLGLRNLIASFPLYKDLLKLIRKMTSHLSPPDHFQED